MTELLRGMESMLSVRGGRRSCRGVRTRQARRCGLAIAACVPLSLNPLGAVAQTQGESDAPAQGPMIEQIIVTAQKRSENLQEVPISINAITADAAAAAGVENTLDLGSLTSGLVITNVVAVPAIFIRGIGTPNTFAGEEASNAIYVDGVYYASAAASAFSLNSIERIEVLKGPQGTLFGRNSTGGLVHIITRDPTHDPTLRATASYGNYDAARSSLYGSLGLSETVAADIAVSYADQGEGFGFNRLLNEEIYKSEELALRSKVLWEPSSSTRVVASADYSDSSSTMATPRSIIPGAVALNGATYLGDPFDVLNDRPGQGISTRNKGLAARLEQDVGSLQFVSQSAYREYNYYGGFDQDATAAPLVSVSYDQVADQFTQELQLQGQGAYDWIVGLFYLDSMEGVEPLGITGATQAPLGGFNNLYSKLDTQSYAAYAQVTAPLQERTNVTVGLRYTEDEKHLKGRNETGAAVNPVRNVTDKEASWSELTWRLALDHRLGDDMLVYGSWNRGFKSGGFAVANLNNPPIDPETLDAYEIGLKSELFDGRLRANLAGFYYSYSDIQLSQVIVGTSLVVNAAEATSYGAEADFVFVPTRNLALRANLSVIEAEYDKFPNAPAALPNPVSSVPPGYTCLPPFSPNPGGNKTCTINDASGNRMIRSPETTLSAGVNYTIPTAGGNFNADLSYYYNSGYFYEADNRLRQPAYGLVNAQLSWTAPDERYAIRLWGKNLADEVYYGNISSSLGDNGTWAPPRTYGVTLEMNL